MEKRNRTVLFILFIFSTFIYLLIFPTSISAGEYLLLERFPTGVKDHTFEVTEEVCWAYEENLNSFEDLPHAMVCERKINPKFSDFKKPEWKDLNVWENREKVWEIDKFLFHRRAEDKSGWLVRLKKRIEEKRVFLGDTWIDINNDGKIDHVLKYEYGTCDPTDQSDFAMPGGRNFIVWDDERNRLDINKNLNNFLRIMLDIFIYKGRVYLDHFGGNLGFQDGTLSVFTSTSLGEIGAKICVYKYKDQTKGGK